MNFTCGEKLAALQDSYLNRYINSDEFSQNEIDSLLNNAWIKLADVFAPSYLVIRQYCLIDIIRGTPDNKVAINVLCKMLAPMSIWLEGYSFWLQVKKFLVAYSSRFFFEHVVFYTTEIDASFLNTSYSLYNVRYPAPFGDLQHIPLEDSLQKIPLMSPKKVTIGNITRIDGKYEIKASPVLFNLHVQPIKTKKYTLMQEKLLNTVTRQEFKWYKDEKTKYPTIWLKILDILNPKRILSIII